MPNLDPIHDHAGSAADPDFTIDEDDRIGALIEAVEAMRREHAEFTKAVSSAAGIIISEVTDIIASAVKQFTEAMSPLISTVNELADGAGLAPVEVRSTACVEHDLTVASVMTLHGVKAAALLLCNRIRENIDDLDTKILGNESEATVRMPGALCTIYPSGNATTAGDDRGLRDDLRSILRSEGFNVLC